MPLTALDAALLDAADRANGAIEAQAFAALGLVWDDLDLTDYPSVQDALTTALPALVGIYGAAAAQYGVQWCQAARAAHGYTSVMPVRYGAMPTRDELAASARCATHSLYVSHDPKNARTLAEGALQKHVLDVQRRTIIGTTAEDRRTNGVIAGWGIKAAPGCCKWCSLKDTDGKPLYHSEQTALATFHDWCRCKPFPVYKDPPRKPKPKPKPEPVAEPVPTPTPEPVKAQHGPTPSVPGPLGPVGVKTPDGKPSPVERMLARKKRAGRAFYRVPNQTFWDMPKRTRFVAERPTDPASAEFFKGLRLVPEGNADWAIFGANPGYETGRPYRYNCGLCTVTTELRMRGWDVIARPVVGENGTPSNISHAQWDDLTGRGKYIENVSGVKAAERRLLADMPDGARGSVTVFWKRSLGGGGHIFNWQRVGDEIVWLDGQNGTKPTTASLHSRVSPRYDVQIMRLDNLELADLEMVALPRKGKRA